MKMNLSVVMGMVDKVSAPLKKAKQETNKYTEGINKLQKAQTKDSAAMGMITSLKQSQQALKKNAIAIASTSEKLEQLKVKAKTAEKPSAALTEKILKQQERLAKLKQVQTGYKESLGKVGRELKKAGVNTKKLDSEYQRLNKSYKAHGKEITKIEKKYGKWQKRLTVVQKLNSKLKPPKVGGAIASKGTAFLGGLSLAGLILEVNSSAAEMDKLAKKAGNLNLPISELQAMQKQAEHAGVSSDAMSASLTRFTRRLGLLQQTGGGALGSYLKGSRNAVFKDLKDANDTQEAYEMLVESFSKLETAQEQMAFADAAFGDSGREMLIMLREGTEGLSNARKELADLGGGASAEDAAKAEAYNDALQRIQESVRSIKFAALAPIMEKATHAFDKFTEKFKDAKWRDETIKKITTAIEGMYNALEFVSRILAFAATNFREVIAVIAVAKTAMIALNAVILGSPMGLMVAGVMAAIIGITYLVDKFWGLDEVMTWISDGVQKLWEQFKKLINMLPNSLIPDGWKIETNEAGQEVDSLVSKLDKVKDKNAQLGITTDTTEKRRTHYTDYHTDNSRTIGANSGYNNYAPIRNQNIKSKSEVALTIKSDKPVAVDKAKSDKHTDIDLDVGNISWSY